MSDQDTQPKIEAPEDAQRQELNTKYSRLFRDGKLVQLHVRKWPMATRLAASDLPLRDGETPPEFAELGRKRLIADVELRKFNTAEASARAYLRCHAHSFPIAQAHFVPTRTLLAVLQKLEEYKESYEKLTASFVQRYPELKEAYLQKFADQRTSLEPHYPEAASIRERFGFSINVFQVAFPDNMQAIDLATLQAEDAARRELQSQIEAQLRRQTAQSMQELDSFIQSAAVGARGRVVEVFETMARKLQNGEVVSDKNVKKMINIVDAFDGLDFMDDRAVRNRLADVKALLTTEQRDFKSDKDALQQLGTAVDSVLAVARNISDIDELTGQYQRRIVL